MVNISTHLQASYEGEAQLMDTFKASLATMHAQ